MIPRTKKEIKRGKIAKWRIEEALLDIALCLEAGNKWYNKQHPEGIYQRVAEILFASKGKKKRSA